MKTEEYDDISRDVESARRASQWAIDEAKSVYADLRTGKVKVPHGVELNNAIGKANAAAANMLKSAVVRLGIARMEIASSDERLDRIERGDLPPAKKRSSLPI